MGLWVFVTVERTDVKYKSDQDNLIIADFIFLSFSKMCLVIRSECLPRYVDECVWQSSRCKICKSCLSCLTERDEQLKRTFFSFSFFIPLHSGCFLRGDVCFLSFYTHCFPR